MKFQEAIISVINDFGKDVLTDKSLMNILNDYNAFEDDKSYKFILSYLISEKYIGRICDISNWEVEAKQHIYIITENTGFDVNKVTQLFNYIGYAVGLIDKSEYIDFIQLENRTNNSFDDNVIHNKSIESNQYAYDDSINRFIVSPDITTIKTGAFRECANLKVICISNSVRDINELVFEGCNLDRIIFTGNHPPKINSSMFGTNKYNDNYGSVKEVIVPIGSEISYIQTFERIPLKNLRINLVPVKMNELLSYANETNKNYNPVFKKVVRIEHTNGIVNRESFAKVGFSTYINCDAIIIQEGAKFISPCAVPDIGFTYLSKTLKIILPSTIEKIGKLAFPYAMLNIEFKTSTPPLIDAPCMPWGGNVELIIPQGSFRDYYNASLNWCVENRQWLKITEA